ncbi:MAG TPA: PepSY domain-containing protein, partial [bacterium]|nr:PepSY domain-containing protein [bacterium]
ALPLFIVLISGLLLQVRKEIEWIQPNERQGTGRVPSLTFEQILEAARRADAGIDTWEDIDRVDVRPEKGILKIRGRNLREIQVDSETGEILHAAVRRSDIISQIHEGSWFHPRVRMIVFLPSAVITLILWFTGLILYFQRYRNKAKKRTAARLQTQ